MIPALPRITRAVASEIMTVTVMNGIFQGGIGKNMDNELETLKQELAALRASNERMRALLKNGKHFDGSENSIGYTEFMIEEAGTLVFVPDAALEEKS